MALANFSLPFNGLTTQNWAATISPLQPHHATAVNNLLYGPAGHQESDEPPVGIPPEEYYKNDPYSPPSSRIHHQYRPKTNNNYLPPPPLQQQQPPPSSSSSSSLSPSPPQTSSSLSQRITPQQQRTQRGPQYNQPGSTYLPSSPTDQQQQTIRTYGEGSYGHPLTRNNAQQTPHYLNDYNSQSRTYSSEQPQQPSLPTQQQQTQPSSAPSLNGYTGNNGASGQQAGITDNEDGYPHRPPGFTRVKAGQGSRTQVHAVLDYDADEDDEYYDQDDDENPSGKYT